jgi:hypothetical protein
MPGGRKKPLVEQMNMGVDDHGCEPEVGAVPRKAVQHPDDA